MERWSWSAGSGEVCLRGSDQVCSFYKSRVRAPRQSLTTTRTDLVSASDVKRRPVMGNKSSPELTLSLLLMAALYLEAFILRKAVYCPPKNMTWPEARLYCQENYIDMVTLNAVDKSSLANYLIKIKVKQVWIGLLRDPENDSVWKWINLKWVTRLTLSLFSFQYLEI